MKFKSLLLASTLMSAFAVDNAYAVECTLSIPSTTTLVFPYVPVARGQSFTFTVTAPYPLLAGPLPDVLPQFKPFTVVFYGTKDGVNDLPSGWQYPSLVNSYNTRTLSGFANPLDGSLSGLYTRYARIYDKYGREHCITNEVTALLL